VLFVIALIVMLVLDAILARFFARRRLAR